MPGRKTKINLKPLLEKVLVDFPPRLRVENDPVQFPRRFFELGRSQIEIEAVALLAAMLAYGSAKQFIKKIAAVMDACSWNYLDLISGKTHITWPQYRLSTADEIATFARASGLLIKKQGSLKKVFMQGFLPQQSIRDGLEKLHQELKNCCLAQGKEISRGLRHLLPDPTSGGCVKRWHMFLRWLVRKDDGVDLNLWPEVDPSLLLIPLDRHISRIARNLGLTSRNTDDWKTAAEISQKLREFDRDDPIKYDFSLCHLGIAGECTHGKDAQLCQRCLLRGACSAFTGKT